MLCTAIMIENLRPPAAASSSAEPDFAGNYGRALGPDRGSGVRTGRPFIQARMRHVLAIHGVPARQLASP